jgi:hypothetical protein
MEGIHAMMISPRESYHTLQISKPEELSNALPGISNNGVATHYVALAVNNPKIMVHPFQLDNVPEKEIKNHLILEAVEFLSLPADAVELDYQVFESSQNKIRGVFVCYPKTLLQDYLSVLDQSGYIPVKIVPSILAGIDAFLVQYKGSKGRICLFDFSQDRMIYFAVFSKGHCDFLRQIPYEEAGEIEHEVIQSLRCACAISSIKKFDHIFFSGNVPHKTELIKRVRHLFCDDVTHGYFTDVEASLRRTQNIIALNLIEKKTFSLRQRQMIKQTIRASFALCYTIIFVLSIMIWKTELDIRHLKSLNHAYDYGYAQSLQRQLEALQ